MKPIVYYYGNGNALFEEWGGFEYARIYALKHPHYGDCLVTTSAILEKFDDGSFETRNTIYKPMRDKNWVYFSHAGINLAAEYETIDDDDVEVLQIQLAEYNFDIYNIVTESTTVAAYENALEQERNFDQGRKESAEEGRYAD